MLNQIRNISAAAAMLAAIPVLASAHSVAFSNAPVSITSCSVNESIAPTSFSAVVGFANTRQLATNDVALGYVNKGAVPATTVKVTLNDGNYEQNLVARGTFTPGVQIDRTFAASDDANALTHAACSVSEVDFADGTAWHAAPRDSATQ